MTQVLVTIGIPFYNAKHVLADSIRSVFAQTFTDWELILIDDGSFDHSYTIAKSVNDSRVKVVRCSGNKGLAYCLNEIARIARGKYLARMDADDLMHPNRIEMQFTFLKNHPEVDLIGTNAYTINMNNEVVRTRDGILKNVSQKHLLKSSIMIHPTVMAKTSWFRENQYDGRFLRAEDHELWCRTYNKSKIKNLQMPLYFYREGGIKKIEYLRKYLQSSVSIRKIILMYGPKIDSKTHTFYLLMLSIFKDCVYILFTALTLQNVLINMRSRKLNVDESQSIANLTKLIRETAVPGL